MQRHEKMPCNLIFKPRNFVLNAIGDGVDCNYALAEREMCTIKHIEESYVMCRGHAVVSRKGHVNTLDNLTNDRSHQHQLLDQPRGEQVMQRNGVQICSHLKQKVAIKSHVASGKVVKSLPIPVEIPDDSKKKPYHAPRNCIRRFRHPESLVHLVAMLQPPSILELAFCLSARNPSRSHDCDESTNCLCPTGPLRLVQVEAHAYRDEKCSYDRSKCPKLHGAKSQKGFYRCHNGILA
jgi:hypothetical protein